MRPAKEFRAAREAFKRDQQSWTFFDQLLIFAMRYQKLIARLNYVLARLNHCSSVKKADSPIKSLFIISVDEHFFSFLTGFTV